MPQPAEHTSLTRGHKKKERTRRQLVAAAVDVLAENGEAFTISDVVNHAGVANGTFYNYFTDRDELIDAVVPEVLAAFAAESALIIANDDPAVRFASISALALQTAAASPDQIRVVLRLEAIQRAIEKTEVVGHLRTDLEAGMAAGRFVPGDLRSALDVVVGSLVMAARRIVVGEADDAYRRAVIDRLLCSLGVEPNEATAIADQAIDAVTDLHSQSTSPS